MGLLLGGSLGCAKTPSSEAPNDSNRGSALIYELTQTEVRQGKTSFALTGEQAIAPVAALVERLSEQKRKRTGGADSAFDGVVFRPAEETPSRVILRAVLSAQSAGLSQAWLDLREGVELELTLPDSERAPPLAAADVYLWVSGKEAYLGRELAEFGEIAVPIPSAPLSEGDALEALLRAHCSSEHSCQHAALRVYREIPFGRISPLLLALSSVQKGTGTLRLLVDEDAPGEEIGEGSLSGEGQQSGLTRAAVKQAIEAHREQLVACHQGGQEGAEVLGGTVHVDFTVTNLGIVFDALAVPEKSTLKDPAILACVAEEVTKIRFPKPQQSSPQSYTVRF